MASEVLHVWLDRYGAYELVGELRRVEEVPSEARFKYDAAYLSRCDARPISLSLPLCEEPCDMQATRAFFGGLMPDGLFRRQMASAGRFDQDDFCSFLDLLHNETIGALVFSSGGDIPGQDASYHHVSFDRIAGFALSPVSEGVSFAKKAHLSLAGAMTKIGLYGDGVGNWFLPSGGAPSTHILKSGREFEGLACNEAICLGAARVCGIAVPDFELLTIAEGEPLLAIRRFDRPVPENALETDGLPVPRRLHQEDFCQALGRDEVFKYEQGGGDYLPEIRKAVAVSAADPVRETEVFARQLVFDFLIGNNDNHLKNYSFLHGPNLGHAAVSPHYDCVSTSVYGDLSTEMGVPLSRDRSSNSVTRDSLVEQLCKLFPSREKSEGILLDIASKVEGCVEESRDTLVRQGHAKAAGMGGRILEVCSRKLGQLGMAGEGSYRLAVPSRAKAKHPSIREYSASTQGRHGSRTGPSRVSPGKAR